MAIYQEHWKKRDPITAGFLTQTARWLANMISFNAWLDIAYQAERVIFSIRPQVKHSVVVDSDAVISLKNDEAAPGAVAVYGVPYGATEPQWYHLTQKTVVVNVTWDGTDLKKVTEVVYVYQPDATQTTAVVMSATTCPP